MGELRDREHGAGRGLCRNRPPLHGDPDANSANQALDRIINFFPEERHGQLLDGLVSQPACSRQPTPAAPPRGQGPRGGGRDPLNTPLISDMSSRARSARSGSDEALARSKACRPSTRPCLTSTKWAASPTDTAQRRLGERPAPADQAPTASACAQWRSIYRHRASDGHLSLAMKTYDATPSQTCAFLGLGVIGRPMAVPSATGRACGDGLQPHRQGRSLGCGYGNRSAATPRERRLRARFVFACVGNDDDLRQVVQFAFAGERRVAGGGRQCVRGFTPRPRPRWPVTG